jgi:DNA-binding MarR family transcriptional regulator
VLPQRAETSGLSLNDLAARTRRHQSSVSTVVPRLVERGLVLRSTAPDDAPRLELRLSLEAGQRRERGWFPTFRKT